MSWDSLVRVPRDWTGHTKSGRFPCMPHGPLLCSPPCTVPHHSPPPQAPVNLHFIKISVFYLQQMFSTQNPQFFGAQVHFTACMVNMNKAQHILTGS